MSELILKGTDLFMKKTGSADKLHISGNTEIMLFLIIGIHFISNMRLLKKKPFRF